MDEVRLQREYYAKTAAEYDSGHVYNAEEPEHSIALGALIGLSFHYRFDSFLDVGCGTGCGVAELLRRRPDARVIGVEPVAELRAVGAAKGIPESLLVDGDATKLTFEDGAFDCVCAFGILHHIREPRLALAEMLRVARKAVFISDLNNFGCGGALQRIVSQTLNALGLWKAFQFLATKGKGYKYSEGDGIHYSYSIYSDYRWLSSQCSEMHVLNTKGAGINPYRTCSHGAILAIKK